MNDTKRYVCLTPTAASSAPSSSPPATAAAGAAATTTTGSPAITACATTFQTFFNTVCTGTKLTTYTEVTVAECQDYCRADPNCAGVNFNPAHGECRLKELGATITSSGINWYLKSC